MEDITKNAIDYFKSNKKYHRILKAIAEKYRKKECVSGIIELKNMTYDEKLMLCAINRKFIDEKDARFRIEAFLKSFEGTKLEGFDVLEVLKGYFKEELRPYKEIKKHGILTREKYFADIIDSFTGSQGSSWLLAVLEKKAYGYTLLMKEYETDAIELQKMLYNVLKAVNSLSYDARSLVRIAIFASNITKNPHYFDNDRLAGKLLQHALAYLKGTYADGYEDGGGRNSEQINELLYGFGIIKDEISNFTNTYGMTLYSNGEEHQGASDFYRRGEPLQLNLLNLSTLDNVKCKNNILYIFENPTVFSEVLYKTVHLKPSLMCTSGQLKLASIVLLDKLVRSVDKIYYSGDFDPEGLYIAYKLKLRYGEKLCFWRYDIEAYEKIKSELAIDDNRLKQLDNIKDDTLSLLVEKMKEYRKCGYQELLVEEYVIDIEKELKEN